MEQTSKSIEQQLQEAYTRGYHEGFHDGRDSLLHPERYQKQIDEDEHHHVDHPDWGEIVCTQCGKTFKGVVFHDCTNAECPL